MIKIFKTNQIVLNILLLVYAFVIRSSGFVLNYDFPAIENVGFWFFEIQTDIASLGQFHHFVISTLLIVFQAVLLNLISNALRFHSDSNLLVGVFYILLSSFFTDFHFVTPVLIANTFVIFALYELFKTYRSNRSSKNLFNTGMCTVLASFFYSPYIFLLIAILFGLNTLRAFKAKEMYMIVIGAMIPIFLTFTYTFWFEKSALFFEKQFAFKIFFFQNTTWSTTHILETSFMCLLLLIIGGNYPSLTRRKSVTTRKYLNIIFLSLMVLVLTMLIFGSQPGTIFLLLAVPMSYCFGLFFMDMQLKIADILHISLLAILLVFHYILI